MEQNSTIKEGAVVYLKSGGPAMTVLSGSNSNGWVCTWFSSNSEVNQYRFDVHQLTTEKPTTKWTSVVG